MFRKFLQFHSRLKRISELERCHRVNCPCVTQLQSTVFSVKNEKDHMQKYEKCLAQSKRWKQKWPL